MISIRPPAPFGEPVGSGEHRDDVRELGGLLVQAVFRLVKSATLHAIDNQAMTRAVTEAVEAVHHYGHRSGQNVSLLFSSGSILVGGQLLKANRSVYEGATELGLVLHRMGVGELGIAKDVRASDFYAFASAVAESIRNPRLQISERPSPGIRLRPVKDAVWARESATEQQDPATAVVRTYASAVVIMRRFFEDMRAGRHVLPQRVKRVAQRLVDLSAGETPAFLGVTAARNANHDDAGRAVNTAILALAMARQISEDVVMLVRLAMAALLYDAGRARAGVARTSRSHMIPQLSEQQDLEMPAGAVVVLTALGGVSPAAIMRAVTAYEAHWLKRQSRLGPLYGRLRQPTLHARILAVARAFNDHLTPLPGQISLTADQVIAALQVEAQDPADRTVLRILIGALGIFPTGTLVELSTGEVALVVQTHSHPSRYSQPRIRLVFDSSGGTIQARPEIDLSEPVAPGGLARSIVKVVATADDATVASLRATAATPEPSLRTRASPTIPPPAPVAAFEMSHVQAPSSSRLSEPPETRIEPATRVDDSPTRVESTFTFVDPVPPAVEPPSTRGDPQPPSRRVDPPSSRTRSPPPSRRIDPRVEPPPPSRRIDPRMEPPPPSRRADPPSSRMEPPPPSRRIDPRAEPPPPSRRADPPSSRMEPQPPSRRADPPSSRMEPQPPSRRIDPRVEPQPPSRHADPPSSRMEPQPPSRRIDPRVEPQPPSRRADPPSSRMEPQPPSRRVDPRVEPVETISRGAGPSVWAPASASDFAPSTGESPEPPSTRMGPLSTSKGSAAAQPFDPLMDLRMEPELTPAPTTRRAASQGPGSSARSGRHGPEDQAPGMQQRSRKGRARRRSVEHDEDALGSAVMEDANPTDQAPAGTDTPPTAEGTLSRTPLAHLLVYMLDQRLSGTTVFNAPHGVSHTVCFRDGAPAKIRTGGTIAPLDRVLLELGMLDDVTLRSTLLEISKLKILHGRHLVSKGLLTRDALMTALKLQLVRKLTHLFELPPTTRYAYYNKLNLLASYGGPELTPCEPLAAILAGVRIRSDDPLIDATLDRVSGRALGLHPDSEPKRFEMLPDEMAVADLLRVGRMPLAELLSAGVAQQRVVRIVVYVLAITRHLDYGATGARPPVGIHVRERAARTSSQGRDTDPQAAARAQSYQGAEWDTGGSPPPPTIELDQPTPPVTATRPESPSRGTTTPREVQSDEIAARRAQIEQRVASIDSEDYFQMLGVDRDAQPDELKAVYFSLVKVWHPDRLPRDLAPMKPQVARVFGRLTEAYQTLSDSALRVEYVRVLGEGGGTPEDQEKITRTVDAALEFQKAEILLKKNDFAGAEDLVSRAAEADPEQHDYLALLTWIRAVRRGDPPQLQEGKPTSHYDDLIETLDSILRQEPRYERALFYRGMLLKRSGHLDAAIRDFRLVAELNPKNIDAVREVRLHQMRARTGGQPPKPPTGPQPTPSLFGKLFKR